ncbi:MAG: hypothetical protein AAGF04_04130 [Chlamydiota bacterium]
MRDGEKEQIFSEKNTPKCALFFRIDPTKVAEALPYLSRAMQCVGKIERSLSKKMG